MQTVSRYLINNLVIAFISGYHGRNSSVYDRRLTLHRGVSNPITFTFKNEDQKKQDVSTKTFASGNYYELNVIDSESKKSVISFLEQSAAAHTSSSLYILLIQDPIKSKD